MFRKRARLSAQCSVIGHRDSDSGVHVAPSRREQEALSDFERSQSLATCAERRSRRQGPTPTMELCRADGGPELREGETSGRVPSSLSGGVSTGLTPLIAWGGWELPRGPHTGKPPLSAESLPFFRRLCWSSQEPSPSGTHSQTERREAAGGECQHVNEPEKSKRTVQERGGSTSQMQGASERRGRNSGK